MYTHTLSGLPDPRLDSQFYDGVPFKRFLAWLVDTAIITVLTFVLAILSVGILFFVYFGLWFLVGFVYRAATISAGSATLGMRLVSVELRNVEGNRFSPQEALWHTALYSVIFFVPFGVIVNAVMMLISERGQGLHDHFLGTTAINRPADM